jgi:alpha-glucosidase
MVVQSVNMQKSTFLSLILGFLILNTCGFSLAESVTSPNGNVVLTFNLEDLGGLDSCPVYGLSFRGKPILEKSKLGFKINDGKTLAENFEILSTEFVSHDSTWKPVYGERNSVRDHYNQFTVRLVHANFPVYAVNLHFRCYDQGAAMRWEFPGKGVQSKVSIQQENTEFRFLDNHEAWCVNTAQGEYEKKTIKKMGSDVERPLVLKVNDNTFAAITEAGLVDYPRMKLARSAKNSRSVVSRLSGEVISDLPMTTPWRVVMLAQSPGELLGNNDIILNLNEPCAIEDTSWIKPGKVIREVTLTTAGGKACVDFAVEHNLQYVEFDAGWYGPEYGDDSDARTVTVDPDRSPGPLDLREVIRYGEERGVGILLYVNRLALERQLDEILPLYKSWGVKGVKYGFVQVGSRESTDWLHKAVRAAAEQQLMVDVHDEYRPTGYSRTYPNLMTQEGIGGDETSPKNEQTLTLLFTRMLAGAADNTICYYSPRVEKNATHAYQLAKAVCFYSPLQFLYWYDRPPASPGEKGGAGGVQNLIGDEPELEFFDAVPTVWDDTRVVHGRIGEYAVIARRSGAEWFIGSMNSKLPRELDVSLDFLDKGKNYTAHIYSDDESVNTRTRVKIEQKAVNSETVLRVKMVKNGGQAIRIVPGI